MTSWTPESWQQRDAAQQPTYPDPDHLRGAVERLSKLPPLVTSWEIEALKAKLAKAAKGEAFVLQGGDCAESFDACDSDSITATLKILLKMSLVLVHGTKKPIVRIGRIAGQYAKPRSADIETRDGESLPSYRGDLVNRAPFNAKDRAPDPELLLKGYERAALTLNFIRSLADGGFSDLHHPEYWNLSWVEHSKEARDYERIVDSIRESIEFLEAIFSTRLDETQRVDFYTSHEGLVLHYEQAQTRKVPRFPGWYNLSTHLPWIGMRTAAPDGAHVEFFRGIRNPVGIKIGPKMDAAWLKSLIETLNPENEPGRLMLIHRMGAETIKDALPPLIEAAKETGKSIVWCADPMHGNTESTASGLKTRRFDKILMELHHAFSVHESCGTILGGVHFELTGQNVTECVGGARGLAEEELAKAYQSPVDPRLNYEQSLEMAMLIAHHLRGKPKAPST